jgi:hypothetical protein
LGLFVCLSWSGDGKSKRTCCAKAGVKQAGNTVHDSDVAASSELYRVRFETEICSVLKNMDVGCNGWKQTEIRNEASQDTASMAALWTVLRVLLTRVVYLFAITSSYVRTKLAYKQARFGKSRRSSR